MEILIKYKCYKKKIKIIKKRPKSQITFIYSQNFTHKNSKKKPKKNFKKSPLKKHKIKIFDAMMVCDLLECSFCAFIGWLLISERT